MNEKEIYFTLLTAHSFEQESKEMTSFNGKYVWRWAILIYLTKENIKLFLKKRNTSGPWRHGNICPGRGVCGLLCPSKR